MIGSLLAALGRIVRTTLWKAARAAVLGLIIGIVVIEILAAVLNKVAGAHGFVSFHVWPPVFNTDVFTEFVHITAILFGLAFAAVLALVVLLMESLRTLMYAANHVDEAAQTVLNRILGTNATATNTASLPDQRRTTSGPDQ
jgi:uncharacterized membrane protein YedE/YeeE